MEEIMKKNDVVLQSLEHKYVEQIDSLKNEVESLKVENNARKSVIYTNFKILPLLDIKNYLNNLTNTLQFQTVLLIDLVYSVLNFSLQRYVLEQKNLHVIE